MSPFRHGSKPSSPDSQTRSRTPYLLRKPIPSGAAPRSDAELSRGSLQSVDIEDGSREPSTRESRAAMKDVGFVSVPRVSRASRVSIKVASWVPDRKASLKKEQPPHEASETSLQESPSETNGEISPDARPQPLDRGSPIRIDRASQPPAGESISQLSTSTEDESADAAARQHRSSASDEEENGQPQGSDVSHDTPLLGTPRESESELELLRRRVLSLEHDVSDLRAERDEKAREAQESSDRVGRLRAQLANRAATKADQAAGMVQPLRRSEDQIRGDFGQLAYRVGNLVESEFAKVSDARASAWVDAQERMLGRITNRRERGWDMKWRPWLIEAAIWSVLRYAVFGQNVWAGSCGRKMQRLDQCFADKVGSDVDKQHSYYQWKATTTNFIETLGPLSPQEGLEGDAVEELLDLLNPMTGLISRPRVEKLVADVVRLAVQLDKLLNGQSSAYLLVYIENARTQRFDARCMKVLEGTRSPHQGEKLGVALRPALYKFGGLNRQGELLEQHVVVM